MNVKLQLLLTISASILLLTGCNAAEPTERDTAAVNTAVPTNQTPPTNTPAPTTTPVPTVTPIVIPAPPTGITPIPSAAETKAWEQIKCLDVASLETLLAEFPDGSHAYDAELFIALSRKIEVIQAGQEKPEFVIGFPQLGSRWQAWERDSPGTGLMGYTLSRNSQGVALGISFLLPGCAISFDMSGMPMTSTGDGSIVTFMTNGLEFEYLNSIVIQSSEQETLFFGVIDGLGLVYLHGNGKVVMPNGTEAEFN